MSAAFNALIKRIKAVEGLPQATAKIAAPLVQECIRKNAAAGLDPEGKPWLPTQKGERALRNVGEHITAKAVGSHVITTLEGVEVFHNAGVKGGVPQRRILPDRKDVPAFVKKAVEQAANEAFAKLTGAT